jgi:ketosteroid isomerase-like protein
MTLTTQSMTREQRKSIAVEYFKRLDNGGDVVGLFAETADVHFPKWGIARGKAQIEVMFGEVGRLLSSIRHHYEDFNVVIDEDVVVVEGTSHGVAADGTEWGTGAEPGRWCDVFEIRDFTIHRCFIYLDPDYTGADSDRYPW